MDRYVIFSLAESILDGDAMFWSNILGWTELENATVFTEAHTIYLDLPMPADSCWTKLPKRKDLKCTDY